MEKIDIEQIKQNFFKMKKLNSKEMRYLNTIS